MISGLILIFRHPHKEKQNKSIPPFPVYCLCSLHFTFPKFPKFNSLRIAKLILKATEEPEAASQFGMTLTFGSKSYYSGLHLVTGPSQIILRSGYNQHNAYP